MALAFRLFGNFQWPPSASTPGDGTQDGVLEIHFEKKGDPAKYCALLRWAPRFPDAGVDPEVKFEPPTEKLYDLTPNEATAWFAEKKTTDCTIWIDDGKYLAKTELAQWVAFRGVFLFEQYRDPNTLDVQWPLIPKVSYYDNKTVHSVLRLNRESKKAIFRFDFHLPLPVPRTSLTDAAQKNPAAFPFSAVYNAVAATDKYHTIDTLVGGWIEGDALPGSDIPGETSFSFSGNNNPATRKLGAFGFAARGNKNSDFAIYQGDAGDLDNYWPKNGEAFLQGILWPYGFAFNHASSAWLNKTGLGHGDLSLRFVPPEAARDAGRGQSGCLVYRVSANFTNRTEEDILVSNAGVHFRLAGELGGRRADGIHYGNQDKLEPLYEIAGWLRTAKQLSADCELSWEIARDDIWSDNRVADWSFKVKVRLHWMEDVKSTGPERVERDLDHAGKIYPFDGGLLGEAEYAFRDTRNSLELGEAGLPHSFLPGGISAVAKTVRFALYGSPIAAAFDDQGLITWGRPQPDKQAPALWRRPPMRLSLANPDELIQGEAPAKGNIIDITATGLTFFSHAGDVTLTLQLSHDSHWPPGTADAVEDGEPFFASFKLETADIAVTKKDGQFVWNGRLASLLFERISPKTAIDQNKEVSGHLRIGGPGARFGTAYSGPVLIYPMGRIAAEISLPLPATSIEQAGIDMARTERSGRAVPLLIPIDPTAHQNEAYWLRATETISPRHDRRLAAEIFENSQSAGDKSYVVLSSEPFSVLRFTHKPLSDRGDAGSSSVAVYSGDDRIWQFKKVTSLYHYTLPPQAVGESADKPRRLEIHDLPDGSAEVPPRPFALHDGPDGKPSGLRRRAVEFRLTPSAEIWIRPSDVERGYFMPESAAHDIFRQYGAYGIGAELAYLRAEFLYGLPVGIDVSKERGIARGARVAEIEALTGRLTGPARETDAEKRIAERWNAVRSAVARRPERLEIWARDLDSTIDFTPARFADGVRFALRHTALHRAPVLDLTAEPPPEGEEDYTSPPKIGGAIVTVETPEDKPRHHPQGLSGGALWPVEQLNLFKILMRSPESSGGAIEQIALSPLGGDASQKAEFLNGKVTILSDTRNGFVERQKVEVLGRICAFWHRAKHVVVYERTVNPSAQFAPEYKDDTDRTRSRRPILRKVREYIELLEPERNYPDFSSAAARSAGFLERMRFNSRIINVDSAWSSDVGDFGWQIPLWNRLSARERPQVYAMPDIAFVTTAEGEGDRPVVAQECLDPDYLFFFADFSTDTTSDTNLWPSRLDLDYPNMPLASKIAELSDAASTVDPDDSGSSEGRRRAVSRFLPGLRRFTWRLAPAAQKTAINAGRAGKPVYVGLDTVSFMRATHVAAQSGLSHELKRLLESKTNFVPKHEGTVTGYDYWKSDGTGTGITDAQMFKDYIKDGGVLRTAIASKNPQLIKIALADLRNFFGDPNTVGSGFKGNVQKIIPAAKFEEFKDFTSTIKSGTALCTELKTNAIGMIQRKEMLVRTALQDWVAEADDYVNAVKLVADGLEKKKTIERLTWLAKNHIRPLFAEATKDVGNVDEAVEKTRAALIDLETEIDAVLARGHQRIRQFVAGYDQQKPWSDDRRKAFRAGITACLSGIADDVEAAIEETRQRLGVELNGAAQAIAGHVAKALKELVLADANAHKEVTYLRKAADNLFVNIDATLARLLVDAGQGQIDKLLEAADKITDATLKGRAVQALDALKSACEAAQKALAEARVAASQVDSMAGDALGQVADVVTRVKDILTNLIATLQQSALGLIGLVKDLSDAGETVIATQFKDIGEEVGREISSIAVWIEETVDKIGTAVDAVVLPTTAWLDHLLRRAHETLSAIPKTLLPIIEDIRTALQAAKAALAPDALLESVVVKHIIDPALRDILKPLPEQYGDVNEAVEQIRAGLAALSEAVGEQIHRLSDEVLAAVDQVTTVCDAVNEGVAEVGAYLQGLAGDAVTYFDKELEKAYDALKARLGIDQLPADLAGLIAAVEAFDYSIRSLQNDLSRAYETARMYTDRVFDAASKITEGGISAAPSNILKLYSAVSSAPELAALKADIDRIRSGFDEFADIIETTKANALFNRLGDELKALGLSLPFDKIADRLVPADLSGLDIGRVFRNFGGSKLDSLFKGYKIPVGVRDAIRVTHDFDKKQARAWVQVDINAPMSGRRSLFSLGVFKADFVDMHLTGQVRLEASKDQDKVTETGFGRIGTSIDLVVSGQSMVRFDKFALNFSREKGLEVEFDPKNIRLNPAFKFIQDFLSSLFPDEFGGLNIIKRDGIPIGVEHEFTMPPVALNFGTSGVSNISIENRFKLLAYPDFMLADRFNLSTVERPFIFSIFIIGGTGYIQIEAEYRPFDSELTVVVEAGVGGSASLAFAFGPFSGQVFITLSGALSYRKMIGKPGGGLSISAVLVIAGHVDVAGIVTVGITLMLRMTYRDNGQIDADGTLTVTIRISRFFKITARANAKYKLRGGKSESSFSADAKTEVTDEKAAKLNKAAKTLQEARN